MSSNWMISGFWTFTLHTNCASASAAWYWPLELSQRSWQNIVSSDSLTVFASSTQGSVSICAISTQWQGINLFAEEEEKTGGWKQDCRMEQCEDQRWNNEQFAPDVLTPSRAMSHLSEWTRPWWRGTVSAALRVTSHLQTKTETIWASATSPFRGSLPPAPAGLQTRDKFETTRHYSSGLITYSLLICAVFDRFLFSSQSHRNIMGTGDYLLLHLTRADANLFSTRSPSF